MFEFMHFGRKKATDPLSSLQAISQWLNELPLGDVYVAHDKIVKSLIEFNEKKEPLTKERLLVLMHLDQYGREKNETLSRQYLLNPRMAKSIESRLWNTIYSFQWEATRGYHAFIMDYISHPSNSKIKQYLPQITARVLQYFGEICKWHYFRFEQIDGKVWKRLHNLYRFAEFEEFETDALALYEGDSEKPTTCANLYLHVLMMDVLNTGSLFPKQTEMISDWLGGWTETMRLEKIYDPDKHVFQVDFSLGSGARRIRKIQNTDMCRYWGTRGLISRIEQIRAALLNGDVPAKLGLSEACRLPGCLDFLDDVAGQWAPTVQRIKRKHERNKVVKMIEVVHGLNEIYSQIKSDNELAALKSSGADKGALSYDEMVDVHLYGFVTSRTQTKLGADNPSEAQKIALHERWVMENESERGYGATVNEVGDDWVRLGKLVGLKPDSSANWHIGVVRRLLKKSDSQFYVGMEVLVLTSVAVTLRAKVKHPAGYRVEGIDSVDMLLPVAGFYVPKDEEKDFQNSLIIEPGEFAAGRVFELIAGGKNYSISLGEILEKGDDWLRVAIEVLHKNQSRKSS